MVIMWGSGRGNESYGGHHFAIYKYQINKLNTLNIYNGMCQLYLKAGKGKGK